MRGKQMRAYGPCLVAFCVLLPLITASFIVWIVFFDDAIGTAKVSAENYLARSASDMQTRSQSYIESTEMTNNVVDSVVRLHVPALSAPSQSASSVFSQPGLLAIVADIALSMPAHVAVLRCIAANGRYFGVNRTSGGQLQFELSDDVGTSHITFTLRDRLRNSSDLLQPADTFLSLNESKLIINASSRVAAYRDRPWYRNARDTHSSGIFKGWTDVFNMSTESADITLGIAAWSSFPRNSSMPFGGACAAVSSLQVVHELYRVPDLGRSGVAVLMSAQGTVIVSSSVSVFQRRLQQADANPFVCDVPELSSICPIFKQAGNLTSGAVLDSGTIFDLDGMTPALPVPASATSGLFSARAHAHSTVGPRTSHVIRPHARELPAPARLRTQADSLRPRKNPPGSGVQTFSLSSDQVALVTAVRTPTFNGVFILLGSSLDFENGIRTQRDIAVAISIALLVVAAVAIACVSFFFTRPLVVMTSVLQRMADVSITHSQRLEREGVPHALPEDEWRAISSFLSEDPSFRSPLCARSCRTLLSGKLGGQQLQKLHESLVTMVSSLQTLASKAQDQELLRRKYLRYIFHEVRVPLNSMALALGQLTPRALPSNTVRIVEEQCEAVTGLLNDVLTLDKMEQGQFELSLAPTCVECAVFSTCRMFVPTAISKLLQLRLKIQHLPARVHAAASSDTLPAGARRSPSHAANPLALPPAAVVVTEHELVQVDRAASNILDGDVSAADFGLITPRPSAPGSVLRSGDSHLAVAEPSSPASTVTGRSQIELKQVSGPLIDRSAQEGQRACCAVKVLLDDQRVRQILRNLLSNAFKFTPAGQVSVELWFDSRQIYVSVTDTGVGMDSFAMNRLFRPYVQFANELQTGQGSGLGLSISKRLAQLHGGDLTCQSTLGKGSSFLLQLPLTLATNPPGEPNRSQSSVDEANLTALGLSDESMTRLQRLRQALVEEQRSAAEPREDSRLADVDRMHTASTRDFDMKEHDCLEVAVDVERNVTKADDQQGYAGQRAHVPAQTSASSVLIEPTTVGGDGGPFRGTRTSDFDTALTVSAASTTAKPHTPRVPLHGLALLGQSAVTAADSEASLSQSHSPSSGSERNLSLVRPAAVRLSRGDLKRALVVDDADLNLKLLCKLLEKRGWVAIPALNGEAACTIAATEKYAFELVFIDRNMPIMNGPEAIAWMRAAGFSGFIVGLTGDVSSETIQEFMTAGADLVLPKPIDVKKLGPLLNQFDTPSSPYRSLSPAGTPGVSMSMTPVASSRARLSTRASAGSAGSADDSAGTASMAAGVGAGGSRLALRLPSFSSRAMTMTSAADPLLTLRSGEIGAPQSTLSPVGAGAVSDVDPSSSATADVRADRDQSVDRAACDVSDASQAEMAQHSGIASVPGSGTGAVTGQPQLLRADASRLALLGLEATIPVQSAAVAASSASAAVADDNHRDLPRLGDSDTD